MSFGTVISFDDARKFPPLLRLSQGVQRPDVRKVMGRAIAGALRRHFSRLDSERPNRLGGKRTHFWGQVRRGVQQPQLAGGDGVRVDTNHVGIAQRYFGGDIEAGQNGSGRRYLTLPVHPDAYGHRAREFEDLDFIPLPRERALLTRPSDAPEAGLGEVLYVLVRRVHPEPDPTVLPPEEELQSTALAAGEDHLRTLIARTA